MLDTGRTSDWSEAELNTAMDDPQSNQDKLTTPSHIPWNFQSTNSHNAKKDKKKMLSHKTCSVQVVQFLVRRVSWIKCHTQQIQ